MDAEAHMNEQEVALNRALCNFCNEAGDPFEPASQWNDHVWRAFGNLCNAYNEWYKMKKAQPGGVGR